MTTPHTLHGLLQDSAVRGPERTAVVDGGRSLTYRDLDEQSNQLAHLLGDLGVGRGDRVGLFLNKSLESVVALYGVLKVGGAYVPLDPRAPASRVAYITANCDIRCLLTGVEKAAAWPDLLASGSTITTVVLMNGAAAEAPPGLQVVARDELDQRPVTPPVVPVIDLDLAYILYTSGSTGVPKGVKLSHLNALGFVRWAADAFGVQPEDRVSSHAPLHFDLSIFDLFSAHLGGASVVLVPQKASTFPIEAVRFIRDNEITIWYSVPSILSMMVERGGIGDGDLPSLRTILFAGEVFPTKYLRRLMELLPAVRFANLYGPTETNVCTWHDVTSIPEGDDPVPIGQAIENVEVFAVTSEGRRAAVGEVGELYVRGTTVMNGYWGDAERTAQTLVAHPFDPEAADRAYRTGDLVKEAADGAYEFLGRRDAQIKSRGYRIELGDIESALNAHSEVLECAVIAIPDDLITNRIKAFVATNVALAARDLAAFCAERVPAYMIPETFSILDALPKTSTGKIDRQALQQAGSDGA